MPEALGPGHLGDLLSALLDGELEPSSAVAAHDHIAVCPSCRAELDGIAATRDLLRNLPLLDPPFGLVERIRRRERQRPLAWIAAAAVATAIFVLPSSPQSDSAVARFAGLTSSPTRVGFGAADVVASELGPPYHAPRQLAEGYGQIGVYDRGQAIQIVYSDGRHTLSLFEQAGQLDSDDLPPAPSTTLLMADGSERWALDLAEAQVVTWESGPLTYTLVSDVPLAELVRVAESLPGPRPLSAGQRLLRGARALVDALSGRR